MKFEDLAVLFTKPEAGSFAERRYEICKTCPEFRELSKQCSVCHCLMPVKVKLAKTSCPLNKWGEE